jgi:hypothetical protein
MAGAGRCFVADDVVPVVAEIDAADGRLVALFTWELSPPHRHLPTTTALALQGEDLLVASPAAGGLVRIDRASGGSMVTPIPTPPLRVVVDGESVWIVGAPDLDDDPRPEYDGTRHPVRWEEPTEDDMARHRAAVSGVFAVSAEGSLWPLVDDEAPLPTAADWEDLNDSEIELVDRSRRLYRLAGAGLVTVDIGGEPCGEAMVEGTLICVCWRDDDPLVKRVEAGGWLSYERPATVLAVGANGDVRRIGSVGDNGGRVVIDGGTAWLLGYAGRKGETVQALDVADAGMGAVIDPEVDDVLTIVDRIAVGIVRTRRAPWRAHAVDDEPEGVYLNLLPLDEPGARRRVRGPDISSDAAGVAGRTVWLVRSDGGALVTLDVASGEVSEIALAIDCAHHAPVPEPPAGLDLDGHEQRQLDLLRGSLLSSGAGDTRPFIRGVTFDSVRLDGAFPSSAVVALFHADGYPGVQFGGRWRLYDDLGDPSHLDNADIELAEDVEAVGYGLPARDECVPDDGGIVWF